MIDILTSRRRKSPRHHNTESAEGSLAKVVHSARVWAYRREDFLDYLFVLHSIGLLSFHALEILFDCLFSLSFYSKI